MCQQLFCLKISRSIMHESWSAELETGLLSWLHEDVFHLSSKKLFQLQGFWMKEKLSSSNQERGQWLESTMSCILLCNINKANWPNSCSSFRLSDNKTDFTSDLQQQNAGLLWIPGFSVQLDWLFFSREPVQTDQNSFVWLLFPWNARNITQIIVQFCNPCVNRSSHRMLRSRRWS